MTALFALLSLAQAAPVAEKSGLFEYARPAGWNAVDTPDGARALLAPDGSGAILRFLLPEPWAGTSEAYHEALHAALRQGAPVRSGGKIEPFGGFLRSEAVVGAEGAPAVRMALYTAQVGDRRQGVFFAAGSDAVFEKHRPAADGLVKAIALPGARERASGFEFTMPGDWRREDDAAQGTTSILPAKLPPGPVCGLLVFPAKETPATADEHHDQTWAALTNGATLLEKPQGSTKGRFRATRVHLKNPAGQEAWLILYTAKRGAAAETLFFAASLKDHIDRYGPVADALVEGIAFAAAPVVAAPAPLPPGVKGPRAVPGADRDVKLLGVWINGTTKLQYGVDFGGGFSTRMRSTVYVLALWENGIGYRGVYNAPIFTDNGLMNVPEGLAVVDAAALAAQAKIEDTRFGRWTEKGGVLEMPGNWHGALTLTREGGNFNGADGKWIRLAPVDGVTLDGTYVGAATVAAPEMRLTFRKDGTFEAANLVHAFGGPTNNPAFPVRGRGTYEFRKWSLILRFEGGIAQSVMFHASGEGLAEAKGLVLAGSEFVKR